MRTLIISLFTLSILATGCTHKPKQPDTNNEETTDTTVSVTAEPDEKPEPIYTHKQLSDLQSQIWKKLETLKGTPVANNAHGGSVIINHVEVKLLVNTPEKQQEFREQVIDSPALLFSGSATPEVDNSIGLNDTLGVYLYPEYPVYSTTTAGVEFVLYNRSGTEISGGLDYFITFQDRDGTWRRLPTEQTFVSLGIGIEPNENKTFYALLYPDVNDNRPGRYRYFHKLKVGGRELLLMAEFRLSDQEKEWKNIAKTLLPEEAKQPRPANSPLVEDKVYDRVEQMPQFPGGRDELIGFINKNLPKEITKEGRTILQFVVEKDGTISNIKVVGSLDETMDKEAIRILKKMPRWIPGKQNGHPVRVKYTILIPFRMDPAFDEILR